MENKPFLHLSKTQDAGSSRRRSTRIDYVTTVLLSGKDASGTPFREFTQTSIVNLHGCKVRTSYRILVGMLVTIECPKVGTSGKGVCVRVWDPLPGVAGHEIAIQLIKPQNLWGVADPPPDWELVVKAMVQGRLAPTERALRPASAVPSAASPQYAAPRTPAPSPTPRVPAVPPAIPAVPPVAPPPQIPSVAGPTIEQRLAELERRATQLVESVLDIMRGQAEEMTRNSLEEFRQQVDALIQDAEGRLRQGLQQAYEESAASLIGLRTDLLEQMSSRGAQMIRSTEDTLRSRLRNQFAGEDKTASIKPTQPVTEK
jgi:hypothetical protein